MKAKTITAKLRDAVPVCFMVNGDEMTRYRNIDIPESLKDLEIRDFGFQILADGKIEFNLHFEQGILPTEFPGIRPKMTRAEKAAAKAAKMTAPEPEAEAQPEAEGQPEAEAEPEAEAQPEPEAEAQPETEAQSQDKPPRKSRFKKDN